MVIHPTSGNTNSRKFKGRFRNLVAVRLFVSAESFLDNLMLFVDALAPRLGRVQPCGSLVRSSISLMPIVHSICSWVSSRTPWRLYRRLYLATVGIREMHATTSGKALLIVVLPAILILVLVVVVVGASAIVFFRPLEKGWLARVRGF
jgi:hypothetical protein